MPNPPSRSATTLEADSSTESIARRLAALAQSIRPDRGGGVSGLRQLSGGANQEIWAFSLDDRRYVLRRSPPGVPRPRLALPLSKEAEVLDFAQRGGIPAPAMRFRLREADGLGEGYVMDHLEGETLGPRIARQDRFTSIRGLLARQCGDAIARLHRLPVADAPSMRRVTMRDHLDAALAGFREDGLPRPVMEFATRWLERNLPDEPAPSLVHGDFRNGNIMVDETQGLLALLDWEGASLSDPMLDLAHICLNSWRFGNMGLPVGGFGLREDLHAGYEAAGGTIDALRLRFWEVMLTLRWGVVCVQSLRRFREGDDTVERAMIARRASEAEIDLLHLLAPRG